MKKVWPLLFIATALISYSATAAEPPADHPLAAMNWLVSGVWVAEIPSSDGRPTRVETRFEWAEHGRMLKYVVHFKSADRTVPQYEGMYYWHPGRKHIAMVQVDRSGNVTESVATMDGATLTQENQATQTDGTTRPQRVRIVREGDDGFSFRAMVQREGEWVDAVGFTYKRQKEAK